MEFLRNYIFLKDIFLLSISSFGGPHAHLAHFIRILVNKRAYITEQELLELTALCNVLPGPTSTQTLTAIGYKRGGPKLAYLTLLVWIFPAVCIMGAAGIFISHFQSNELSLYFTKFIQPMAVGFIAYAAWVMSEKVITTKTSWVLMVFAAVCSFFFRSPYAFPILLLVGGLVAAIKFKKQEKADKTRLKINWANFFLWAGVLTVAAVLGAITGNLPIRLFENFYRNGSLIFGGGQVLIPYLYTEFVSFKSYLSSEEFLTGFAFAQSIPGPTFSFTAYIGALSMRNYGIGGEILGAWVAALGIFLPGTFLIFFVIRFWDDLKRYRMVRASLEGINAVSAGMVVAAALILFQPIENTPINIGIILTTFGLLTFTRLPAPYIIIGGLLAGFIL